MSALDRVEHFRHVVSDLCKSAALAGLTLEVKTIAGKSVIGVASCETGDPDELMRVGETELSSDEVAEVKLYGPSRGVSSHNGR